VRAVLRRTRPALNGETLAYEDLTMDLASHRVRRGKRDVHLGPTEFRLLRHFMEHQEGCSAASSFWIRSGARTSMSSRAPSTCISAGSGRRSTAEAEMDLIRTVRSAGYALDRAQ